MSGQSALLRDARIDLRFRCLAWLLAASIPAHFILWVRPILAAGDRLAGLGDEWAPGFSLPQPWQAILGHLPLWLCATFLLLGRGRRAALVLFFLSALLESMLLPGAISNHWTLFLFALGICAFFPFPQSRERAPASLLLLRALCVLTYWFAFLHKLNAGFIDPRTSAAWEFAHQVLQNVPLVDEQIFWQRYGMVFIVASLALEACLPVLLLARPLRRAACLLGLLFHGAILLCQHGEYSQLILSFYVLFFSEAELAEMLAGLRRFSPRRAALSAAAALALLRVSYLHPLLIAAPPGALARAAVWAEWLVVFVLAGLGCYLFLSLLLAPAAKPALAEELSAPAPAPTLAARRWLLASGLLIALYAFNCAGPYLGLQFYHAQAMFSSLDLLEGNHLFLSRIALFHNDDYVQDLRVQWGHGPDPALLALHPALAALLAHRGRISKNYLQAIFAHACRESALVPISISYQSASGRSLSAINPCSDTRYSRLTAYPWFLPPGP